jgi:hypothetical protein
MNVSSSRAPPPNVTTTAFLPRGVAMPLNRGVPNSAAAAPAPVADRRKLRRLERDCMRNLTWVGVV